MLFNSFTFLLFLPIVFLLYWFVFKESLKLQNAFLLLASYVFYGWWDWRFLGLIIASSTVDYWCGLKMGHLVVGSSGNVIARSNDEAISSPDRLLQVDNDSNKSASEDNHRNDASGTGHPSPDTTDHRSLTTENWFSGRKLYLTISLAFNLGLLGFFKYFNFFIDSAADFISVLGFQPHISTLNLILPVGISFYTFQTLSYSIDVYRGNLKPTKDPIAFFTFVAFFPQLVAGPIERASNLLPQFFKKREFEYQQGSDGMKLILWGLFKKMVIADNCALVVNPIFENYQTASGLELIMGAILFGFQIYGDFSGYSDIAIGVAKLFGFDLMTNFRTPYFSRDIAEFWRRWHISLSTWFRDYVYIPLGGSRVTKAKAIRNIFIVFLVSGFWHGANWTFIAWGGIHAALFIPIFLIGKNRAHLHEGEHLIPSIKEVFQMVLTFSLVCIAWVFFRSDTVGEAWGYLSGMATNSFLPSNFGWLGYDLRLALFLFLVLEWVGRYQFNWLERLQGKWYRYPSYMIITGFIIWLGTNENQFIYFQF
ncbi:MBOAT family O-acyltransferase [Algoriphagus antarcticus]|uniref:D-alanyl-lipoteichoic acid acyltransferase DltB (MBOAT superfamily) n=1 Tax=Algoriphagus antarcticus TaxID=238540 RepID=A0A3E0DZS9_9BACT|nr:MBOAT family O-acyltransferase [Algoriphagus antarcticus]REG91508.1 D-alanyl-lipoteichoic acid acyltransferase DltB (MBOAT superfamily) [Algoriphagus antarcticus]